MATLIVNHKVADYATWKTIFDSDEQTRTGAGLKLISVGQKAGEPNNVYMVFDVADASIVQSLLGSPEMQAKMQEAGVVSVPEAVVVE